MDAAGAFFLILILLVVVLLALSIWTTILAKRQYQAVTTLNSTRAQQTIEKSFKPMLWAQADGPGDINRRRRQIRGPGAIVSVKLKTLPDGKTQVSSWVSEFESKFGLVTSRGVSKPGKVIKLIESSRG